MFVCYFTKNQKTRPKIFKKKKKKTYKKKEREDVLAFAYVRVCLCVFLCSWNVNSILHCIKGRAMFRAMVIVMSFFVFDNSIVTTSEEGDSNLGTLR